MFEHVLDPAGGIFVLTYSISLQGRTCKEDTFSNFVVASCKLCVESSWTFFHVLLLQHGQ